MKISAARLKTVIQSMEAYTSGRYTPMHMYQCSDYISWLHRFKKLPNEEIDFLIRWMTAIFEEDSDFIDELDTEYGQSWVQRLKSHDKL